MQSATLAVTAGWSHIGANQTAMPGRGMLTRPGGMFDEYLNNRAYLGGHPSGSLGTPLGRYQVLKRSPSCRGPTVLGRSPKVSEVAWRSEVARRIGVPVWTVGSDAGRHR